MIDARESATAKLCSFARAYHSNYGRQKIFDDYLAYDMIGKEEYEEIGQLIEHDFDESRYDPTADFRGCVVYPFIQKYVSPIPLSRIAYAEAKLNEFADKNSRCQYVICGAGMDTFAFRNENADIEIFELDHPNTQRYKLEKVRDLKWNIPRNVHYVPIDFSKDDMVSVLKNAGFNPNVPTFFAVLGVTYYLTSAVFEQTISKIAQAAKSSEVVFDFPDDTTFANPSVERVKYLSEITAKLGEPMKHGFCPEEMFSVLQGRGLIPKEHLSPGEIQKQFFENRPDGQHAYENIHFILAEKRRSKL